MLLKRFWEGFLKFFGFRRNPKYVKDYLNEANMKSGIYMGAIIVGLEIWLIIRQTDEYVRKKIVAYTGFEDKFKLAYSYLNLYILFLIVGISLFIFALTFTKNKKKDTRLQFILNLVFGSISIFWFFMLFPADDCKNLFPLSFEESVRVANVTRYLLIVLYMLMPVFGGLIIAHTLYKHIKHKNNTIISIGIIITFALICLIFGIRVSYSDFCVPATRVKNGVEILTNYEKRKMITCFLTMVIFVACLLIWKPYISVIMLFVIFQIFYEMISNYSGREFVEGDEINYITFLISLIMVTISIYHQRVEEANKDMKLEHQAKFDYLFEIYNVRYIVNRIQENEKLNQNYYQNKMYLFVNFSNFKIINAQKGVEYGDEFLIKAGKILNEVFKGDLVSRQSDDHFVLFVKVDDLEYKISLLKEMMDEIIGSFFVRLKVGGYRPKFNELPNRCIDKARYACNNKNNTNFFTEYDEKMDDMFNKRQYIVNHIDEAIENGWVKAYYQPVVWANTKELCGAEALARWIDPVYGFLSPGDFIPILEETRLIHKLDMSIIDYVCSEMRRAIDENRPIVPISINFSRLDFELFNVEEFLEETVKKYDIDRRFIHVEITESALSKYVDALHQKIDSLKNLGYAIWLDDFGSGYSSLNVLKDFDIDVIKIDMKFLSSFDTNEKTKDILDVIIKLCDRLNIKSLTEGVETKEEADFLDQIGCGRLQGYLFGKPFKLEEFEQMIINGDFKIGNNLF
ncbi:MAG: GGDEF domain-containing phosphodiesterase [Acholeplasmatales bacterium]|nr:GGDEF domain-containing phosphodiesterase [Acholeplasmatales bacterium]